MVSVLMVGIRVLHHHILYITFTQVYLITLVRQISVTDRKTSHKT